jgi:hypothetical protein
MPMYQQPASMTGEKAGRRKARHSGSNIETRALLGLTQLQGNHPFGIVLDRTPLPPDS